MAPPSTPRTRASKPPRTPSSSRSNTSSKVAPSNLAMKPKPVRPGKKPSGVRKNPKHAITISSEDEDDDIGMEEVEVTKVKTIPKRKIRRITEGTESVVNVKELQGQINELQRQAETVIEQINYVMDHPSSPNSEVYRKCTENEEDGHDEGDHDEDDHNKDEHDENEHDENEHDEDNNVKDEIDEDDNDEDDNDEDDNDEDDNDEDDNDKNNDDDNDEDDD